MSQRGSRLNLGSLLWTCCWITSPDGYLAARVASPTAGRKMRQPTDTERRMLSAGVVPCAWTLKEARQWFWLHGIEHGPLAMEGTKRADRILQAHAKWGDVLEHREKPSSYRDSVPVARKGRPRKNYYRSNAVQFGTTRELTEDELQGKASSRVRGILKSFRDVKVTARDLNAMVALPSPFKGVPRLYPCGRLWRPSRAPDPQELPVPPKMFRQRPRLEQRFLKSWCGRLLQWIAMNPCSTMGDIARAAGVTEKRARKDLERLEERGLVVRVPIYAICPSLVGEDRLFTYRRPGHDTDTAD